MAMQEARTPVNISVAKTHKGESMKYSHLISHSTKQIVLGPKISQSLSTLVIQMDEITIGK